MSVRREIWSEFVTVGIDIWPEILRRSPRIVEAIALRNPNVLASKTAQTVSAYVETEPIVRDGRVLVVEVGIYDRA